MDRRAEQGGVIMSGLLRITIWLGLFCVVAFDAGGIITNRLLLDEAARVAAEHAAEEVRDAVGRRALTEVALRRGRDAAEASLADQPGIKLSDLDVESGVIVLVARRRARVLAAHLIPPLREQVHAEATATARLDRTD